MNIWNYICANWVYVVLSRVRILAGLVLNRPLDQTNDYKPKPELTRWEQDINTIPSIARFRILMSGNFHSPNF